MNNAEFRIKYATKRVLNKSVSTMSRQAWERLILNDGVITEVNSLGAPFENVMQDAAVVAAAAAGYNCSSPGIDIVRYDMKDAPYVYNIDHYTVVQSFHLHNEFQKIVKTAGVENSVLLEQCLDEYVFIVKQKPNEIIDHWSKTLPKHIKNAQKK